MRHNSLLFSAALLFAVTAEAASQQRSALPERFDTLTVRYAESVIGRGIMHWTRRDDQLVQAYVWTSAYDGSSVTDSLFADAATLAPRREVRVAGDTVHKMSFSERGVSVRTLVGGAVIGETSVAGSGLFSSASIEMLAAAMPLTIGSVAEFKVYYAPPSRLAVQTTRIAVIGQDSLDGRRAWRVSASTPSGGSTFWVDETTRTVLRMDTREGDAVITFRR